MHPDEGAGKGRHSGAYFMRIEYISYSEASREVHGEATANHACTDDDYSDVAVRGRHIFCTETG